MLGCLEFDNRILTALDSLDPDCEAFSSPKNMHELTFKLNDTLVAGETNIAPGCGWTWLRSNSIPETLRLVASEAFNKYKSACVVVKRGREPFRVIPVIRLTTCGMLTGSLMEMVYDVMVT